MAEMETHAIFFLLIIRVSPYVRLIQGEGRKLPLQSYPTASAFRVKRFTFGVSSIPLSA
jgi:hypothetical protein